MLDFIFIYCATTLVVANLISILEQTNMKLYILSLFIKEDLYTCDDCNDYISDNWGKLGELLTCPLCYGTWLSLLSSLSLCYLFEFNLIYSLVCMFGCPFLGKRISLVH